jgi:hypothetical protein
MKRICLVPLIAAALLSPVFAEPGWDPDGVKKKAADLLIKEDFAGLDNLAAEIRQKGYDIRQSYPELRAFYWAFSMNSKEPEDKWLNQQGRFQRWVQAQPDSLPAKIALANWYIGYGWKARGTAYANKVSDEGWKLMGERLRQASQLLKSMPEARVNDPEYYRLWIVLETQPDEQNAGSGKTAFQKGTTLAKEYYPLYSERAYYLLPKWFGGPGDWERVLTNAANSFGGDKGDILYARVARAEAVHYDASFFKQCKVDYARIKRGYLAGAVFHGGSDRTADLSNLCYLASIQGDKETAGKVFLDLGPSIYPVFGTLETRDRFRNECGAEALIKKATEAERNGNLAEAERMFISFHPDIPTNPWLKPFYRREALKAKLLPLMFNDKQTYAQLLELDINTAHPNALFELINVAPLAGEWEKAEAAARLFDQKRPWNITGKNILWLCALHKGDQPQIESARNAILNMKTDRAPYQQAQLVISGSKSWNDVRAQVSPNDGYGMQACVTIALHYATQRDSEALKRAVEDMVSQGGNADITDLLQSLLFGGIGRSLTQTSSTAPAR